MKNKYIMVKVEIPIEEDGDLHRRILELSRRNDLSFESAVAMVMQLGVDKHMRDNLAMYERYYDK